MFEKGKSFLMMLVVLLLSGCISPPANPSILAVNTSPPSTPTHNPFPTLILPTATPIPITPDGDFSGLPCSGIPDRTYLFINCDDVRRIRSEITHQPAKTHWLNLLAKVSLFQRIIPDSYDPQTGYVIGGGPGNNNFMRETALAYLVTGDDQFAQLILKSLNMVHSATRQAGNDYDSLFISPIHGSVPYQATLFAYLTIRDTVLLNDDERAQFDTFFMNQSRHLVNFLPPLYSEQAKGCENPSINGAIASATLGQYFRENPSMQPVLEQSLGQFTLRMGGNYDRDGGWCEKADSYASGIFEGLITYSETMIKNGGDELYTMDFNGKSIHDICSWFLKVMTPDGLMPGSNDGVWGHAPPGLLYLCAYRTSDASLTFAAKRYLDGQYNAFNHSFIPEVPSFYSVAWLGLPAPAETAPPWASVLLPEYGAGIFRSDWTKDAQYLFLQFTNSSHHQHWSFGNIVLYDQGQWMLDNGYHLEAYERSISTKDHSTLSLDNANQTNLAGSPLIFEVFPGEAGMMAVKGQPYQNLLQVRSVLWNPTGHHWIVLDDVHVSDSEFHTLEQRWYVSATPSWNEGGHWIFTRQDSMELAIDFLGNGKAEYQNIARAYSGYPMGNAQGVEMDVRPQAYPVRLVTSLAVSHPEEGPYLSRKDSQDGTLVTSAQGDQTWQWLIAQSMPGNAQVDDLSINGYSGWLSKKASTLRGFGVFGGNRLDLGDTPLIKADSNVSIAVNLATSVIGLDAPAETYIQIYWPEQLASMQDENETAIEFSQQGTMLVFKVQAGKHDFNLKNR